MALSFPHISPSPPAVRSPALLFVDSQARQNGHHVDALRWHFELTTATGEHEAIQAIKQHKPAFVVTDLSLPDGTGLDVVRAAKAVRPPAVVLVISAGAEHVPAALRAGCDAVLLKPVTLNLLCARLGRLKRDAGIRLRHVAPAHAHLVRSGTNRVWSDMSCPQCREAGVVSFDHASHRRMWYACLRCDYVWMAGRREY